MLTKIKQEPVAFLGGLQAAWLAALTLGNVFSWWTWSDEQTAAVTGAWTAATALAVFFLRRDVTPSAKLDTVVEQKINELASAEKTDAPEA